jgi:chromosome segregation ATPase
MRSQLAATQAELEAARLETANLRQELMEALALLHQPRHSHTQTTPRSEDQLAAQLLERHGGEIRRQQADLEAARAALRSERKQFEEQQRKRVEVDEVVAPPAITTTARQAAAVRFRSQSSPSLVEVAVETEPAAVAGSGEQHSSCRQEVERLRGKVRYLEQQLNTTENSLRTNQNLASQNSARIYELNAQLVQLKMALNTASRTGDEQRLALDKKEELIRKIVDDKNELLERYVDDMSIGSRATSPFLKTLLNHCVLICCCSCAVQVLIKFQYYFFLIRSFVVIDSKEPNIL